MVARECSANPECRHRRAKSRYGISSLEGAVRGGTGAKSDGAVKKTMRSPLEAFHRAIERQYLPSCSRTHRRPRRLRGPYAGKLSLRCPASRGVRRRRRRVPRAQPMQPPPRCSPCSFQESTRARTPGSAPGRQSTGVRRCVASRKSNRRFLRLLSGPSQLELKFAIDPA